MGVFLNKKIAFRDLGKRSFFTKTNIKKLPKSTKGRVNRAAIFSRRFSKSATNYTITDKFVVMARKFDMEAYNY